MKIKHTQINRLPVQELVKQLSNALNAPAVVSAPVQAPVQAPTPAQKPKRALPPTPVKKNLQKVEAVVGFIPGPITVVAKVMETPKIEMKTAIVRKANEPKRVEATVGFIGEPITVVAKTVKPMPKPEMKTAIVKKAAAKPIKVAGSQAQAARAALFGNKEARKPAVQFSTGAQQGVASRRELLAANLRIEGKSAAPKLN